MTINPKVKSAFGTYGRALLACIITAVISSNVLNSGFTKADLIKIVHSALVAFLPVIIRAVNPKDPEYGIGSL